MVCELHVWSMVMVAACWAAAVCRLGKGYHLRVKMGGSPFDSAHKDGIRTALGLQCPALGAFLYSKLPGQQGMSHVTKPFAKGFTAETGGSVVSVYEHSLASWAWALEDIVIDATHIAV
eukprot:1151510-Pelagomonas_calceolata.AAC.3